MAAGSETADVANRRWPLTPNGIFADSITGDHSRLSFQNPRVADDTTVKETKRTDHQHRVMGTTPTVVAICGSLRETSSTRLALEHAVTAAEDAGAQTEFVDLREWDLPLFDPDRRERGDASALRRQVGDADAVLLGTPVYHSMVSSALKNAFDYLGRDEFEKTTVGLLATAGGDSYAPTLEHLRTGVRMVHGWTVPHEVGVRNASEAFDDVGEFVNPDLKAQVEKLGRMTAEYAFIESNPL
jgi:azobenzene reductase